MLKDPTVRKSIYASIIAAIFVIVFIQPVLNILGQFFVWLGETVYQGLSDSFYEEGARGLREKYSFSLLLLFFGITTGMFTMLTLRVWSRDRDVKKITRRNPKVLFSILTASLLIVTFYLLSLNYAGFQMNASFSQNMRIIRPLIEDKRYYVIDAKWAMMKNRNDYESINEELNQIASKHNIVLPELFWE